MRLSMRVSRQLSRETLPRHLRRAVDMSTVLSLSGCHWQSAAGTERDYNLSREVDSIDYFLSHDWGSSPTLKFIALVLIFNAGPAAVAATTVAISVGCLEAAGIVPLISLSQPLYFAGQLFWVRPGLLSFVCGLVTYVVVFFFWQLLRLLLANRPITAFVDKLCIHQTDMRMKNAGILGLAGFLQDTRVTVILWSPRYFSRLWCAYEVATWTMSGKLGEENKTVFMPLHMAGAVALITLSFVWNILFDFFDSAIQRQPAAFIEGMDLVAEAVNLLLTALVIWLSQRLIRHLSELPRQLSTFSIDESRCGCCDLNHRLADGTRIPCDRELILKTLETWSMEENQDSMLSEIGAGLDPLAANRLLSERISEQLAPMVSLSSGGASVPYSLALKTCAVPIAIYFSSWIPVLWHMDNASARLRMLGDILCVVFGQAPCMMRVTMLLAFLGQKRHHTLLVDLALTAGKVLLHEAYTEAYFDLHARSLLAASPLPIVAKWTAMAVLTCVLFRLGLCKDCRMPFRSTRASSSTDAGAPAACDGEVGGRGIELA